MTCFRITPEEILQSYTFYAASPEVWDGDDVEYALERADWEARESP